MTTLRTIETHSPDLTTAYSITTWRLADGWRWEVEGVHYDAADGREILGHAPDGAVVFLDGGSGSFGGRSFQTYRTREHAEEAARREVDSGTLRSFIQGL